jgi:hypothetical protein
MPLVPDVCINVCFSGPLLCPLPCLIDFIHPNGMDLATMPASPSAGDRSDSSSWFGLGLLYGVGYCPSTDWHWRIKRARGETDLPNSYVNYCLDGLTGMNWDPLLIGSIVLLIGLTALAVSSVLKSTRCSPWKLCRWTVLPTTIS